MFSVEILLDPVSEAAVRAQWMRLVEAGLPSAGRQTAPSNRPHITLAVRERNTRAQVFFHGHDFRAVKVLRNYYEDSGEDAFLMEHHADPDVEYADDLPAERWSEF